MANQVFYRWNGGKQTTNAPLQLSVELGDRTQGYFRTRVSAPPDYRGRIPGTIRDAIWGVLQATSRSMLNDLTSGENKLPEPHTDPASSHAQTLGALNSLSDSAQHYATLSSFWKREGEPHLRPRSRNVRGDDGALGPTAVIGDESTYHIIESKRDLRSSVVSGKEAYWAVFVEFGTATGYNNERAGSQGQFARASLQARVEFARQVNAAKDEIAKKILIAASEQIYGRRSLTALVNEEASDGA